MLTLYGTEGCHLCHDAQSLLMLEGLKWLDIDIIDHPELMPLYEQRIPVLKINDRELNWPFTAQDIRKWLHAEPPPTR
jgi:glutaredoxin